MVKLKQGPDTILTPEQELQGTLEGQLSQEGSSNDMDHSAFMGSDESNSLGAGVPGYQTTGQTGTDDEIEQQIASKTPTPR